MRVAGEPRAHARFLHPDTCAPLDFQEGAPCRDPVLSPEEKRVLERKLKKERKKEERKRRREAGAAAPSPQAQRSGAQRALDYLCRWGAGRLAVRVRRRLRWSWAEMAVPPSPAPGRPQEGRGVGGRGGAGRRCRWGGEGAGRPPTLWSALRGVSRDRRAGTLKVAGDSVSPSHQNSGPLWEHPGGPQNQAEAGPCSLQTWRLQPCTGIFRSSWA